MFISFKSNTLEFNRKLDSVVTIHQELYLHKNTYLMNTNKKRKSMLLQITLLLFLTIVCQGKIEINVTVASNINDVIVKFAGTDNEIITDSEKDLFNITIGNLNHGMRVELGKAPDNIFFKDPTPYGDLFKKFKWQQAKRSLRVVNAEINEIIKKETVLKIHEHINNSTDVIKTVRSLYDYVENDMYSSWSENGLPEEDIFYNVTINFGDTPFQYETRWRDRTQRSTIVKIGVAKKGLISIKPGQTIVTKLKAFKTIISMNLKYRAQIVGNLIGDYQNLYGKYHFYSPTMENIMKAAGLKNHIETTESLEVICYTDPAIDVFDKDTGLTITSHVSLRFRHLRRNKPRQ
ncbi:unnamed protein product [Diatraea saccharalis]|uniref:Uncharacterized protein n=1 Tax=Diatraea saccharalis TaxID=40085 RepID=A0A9N9WFR3_9NEOP|nr:unnamed protein product [Diatraea saccharalis]